MNLTGRQRTRAARTVATLAVVACALLAGCASVPTSGPIRSGSAGGDQRGGAGIDVQVDRPRPGLQPEAVVAAFVEAMASSTDVAKLYMTKQAAADWKPDLGVLVYDGTDRDAIKELGTSDVRLEAPKVAALDSRGVWEGAKAGETVAFDFHMRREGGEWRVGSPPGGLLLEFAVFQTVYQPRTLYFFTPRMDALVPDLVFLPVQRRGAQETTLRVQALLEGPTKTLDWAVQGVVPPGTEVVSVPVDADGVATVSLNEAVNRLDSDQRSRLAAQLAWTLDQAPGVQYLKVTANGAPFEIDGTADPQAVKSWEAYGPAFGVGAGHLFVLGQEHIYGVEDVESVVAKASQATELNGLRNWKTESLAVDIDRRTAAAFTGANVVVGSLESDKEDVVKVPTDGEVVGMSFDKDDNLWLVDRAGGAVPRIRMRSSADKLTCEVTAPSLTHHPGSIVQLRVARDGARVVAVIRTPSRDLLVMGQISRNDRAACASGRRAVIRGVRVLPIGLTRLSDVGWSNATELTVLGSDGDGPHQIMTMNVDGSQQTNPASITSTEVPSSYDPVHLAVSPDPDSLPVVADTGGRVLVQTRDLAWRLLPVTGLPVYAG